MHKGGLNRPVSVLLSRDCIVVIMKISENFFLGPVAPSFYFLTPVPIPSSLGTLLAGAQDTRGKKNLRFSTEIAVYLGNGMR